MRNPSFLFETTYQLAWDSTSLGWLKTCPRLYQYHMILQYFGKDQNVHLTFGLIYHKAHEIYDKLRAQGVDHESALREGVRYIMTETASYVPGDEVKLVLWAGDTVKNRENLVRTFVWYYGWWVEDREEGDPLKVLILPSGKPAVELSFNFDTKIPAPNNQHYILCGHLDKVADFQSLPYIVDKKTTKNDMNEFYFKQFNPNNQMSLYTAAGQIIYNMPVKGVIIDAARVTLGYSEYRRDITHRSPDQLEEWSEDTRFWIKQAELFASQNYWPMNDKSCYNCEFQKVCSSSSVIRQNVLDTMFVKRLWDPTEMRE